MVQRETSQEVSLRVEMRTYEAVVVGGREAGSRRRAAVQTAALAACLLAATTWALHSSADPRPSEQSMKMAEDELKTTSLLHTLTRRIRLMKTQSLDAVRHQDYNIFNTHFSEDGVPPGHGGTTGVFTGHSMGAKGGPLTIGEGTYFNVFDPDGASDSGPCDPGQHGPPPPAPRDCQECEIGSWCPGDDIDNGKFDQVFACPEHSTTLEKGAYRPQACKCSPGWWGKSSYVPADSCQMCEPDEWCPGGEKKNTCPEHSSSEEEAEYCVCDASYFGEDHDNCRPCTANHFCTGGLNNIFKCPANSESPELSSNGTDCNCMRGNYEPVPAADPAKGPDCVPCEADTYCPGGASNVPCPVHSQSRPGSEMMEECTCVPGYFGEDANSCSECPAGSFCGGGNSKQQCPDHSWSAAGSSRLSDCTCNKGWAGSDPQHCTVCPSGFYCPGDGVVRACQFSAESDPGSERCHCKEGYQEQIDEAPFGPGLCKLCPADMYCSGGTSKVSCTADSSAPPGSKLSSACKCNAGFYRDATDSCLHCEIGSYCPGGSDKFDCPANSNTVTAQSTKLSDCFCNDGFAGEDPAMCSLCPSGYYCRDGGKVAKCPDNSFSEVGASSCECNLGFEYKPSDGTCFRCPSNFYCPHLEGGGDMTPIPCPENAISPEGSFEPTDCTCSDGFENKAFELSGNFFAVGPGTYAANVQACAAAGAQIASINSRREAKVAAEVCAVGDGGHCYIGLSREEGGEGNQFAWVDGHDIVYTAYDLGQPQMSGPETKVVMDSNGNKWHDWGTGSDEFKAVCKKLSTAPVCEAGYGPSALGLQSGFLAEYYFLPHAIDKVPNDYIITATPNYESVEDDIYFASQDDFKAVVGDSMPEDNYAAIWSGMLHIETAGDYEFFLGKR